MTARRPIILVPGEPGTLRELIDGDVAIIEAFADRNGLTWLETVAVASAVNRLRILASAAGSALVLSAQGSDTNIDLELTPKGSGKVRIVDLATASGLRYLEGAAAASAVNYLRATAAATGGAVALSAQGSDTNIDLLLSPKGSGKVRIVDLADATGLRYLEGTAAASAVNYLRAAAAATGGAVVLSAQGTDTNISLQLLPKGTGKVMVIDLAGTNGLRWLEGTAPTSAVNHLRVSSNVTGQGPVLSAQGSDANIHVQVQPKGTGKLLVGADDVLMTNIAGTPTNKDMRSPSNLIAFTPASGSVRQLIKEQGATAYVAMGFAAAPTTDGTVANADTSTRPLLSFTTAASAGAKSGFATAATTMFRAWLPEIVIPVRWGPSLADVRLWIGASNGDLATIDDPTANHVAAFRYVDGVDTTIMSVTSDGSTTEINDTTVAPGASGYTEFRIKLGAANIEFWIDGNQVADHSSILPGSTTGMAMRARVEALTATARSLNVGSCAIWMK